MPTMTAQRVQDKDKTEPQSRYVTVQGREVHYIEWGTAGAPGLVMWHGLARTSRDFDCIAAALADRFHIICPDTIGLKATLDRLALTGNEEAQAAPIVD